MIKRASELATSDPDGGEGALDEAELFRIAHEVGLPDAHVRRALTEIRTAENPQGVIARWFGSATVRVSRIVPGEKERLRLIIDEFLVAGHLLQPVRQGSDVLLYRPAVDWISNFARAGASMSQTVYWASAKEIEVRLEEGDDGSTLVQIDVDPGVRGDYTSGAVMGGLGVGAGMSLGVAALLGSVFVAPAAAAWSCRDRRGWSDGTRSGAYHRPLFAEAQRGGPAGAGRGPRSLGVGRGPFTAPRVVAEVGDASSQEVQAPAVGG